MRPPTVETDPGPPDLRRARGDRLRLSSGLSGPLRDQRIPRSAVVLLGVTAGLIVHLTEEISEGERLPMDGFVRPQPNPHGTGHVLLVIWGALSSIGAGEVLLAGVGIGVALLLQRRRWVDAAYLVLVTEVARVLGRVMKGVPDRHRPPFPLTGYFLPTWVKLLLVVALVIAATMVRPHAKPVVRLLLPTAMVLVFVVVNVGVDTVLGVPQGADAFPSGHATSSMAAVGAGVLLSWRRGHRIWLAVGGAIFVVAVGASRIMLGFHRPTDVLGGWALASSVVLGTWILVVLIAPRLPSLEHADGVRGPDPSAPVLRP